jgi:hypothetical protein
LLFEDYDEIPFDLKAHTIYDRYHWTPEIVENMPMDEVTKHYKIIKEVLKQENKNEQDLYSAFTKYIEKLFHIYLKNRTIF